MHVFFELSTRDKIYTVTIISQRQYVSFSITQEEDRQFLQQILEREREDQRAMSSRREKAKADAHWMKSVIEEQIRVEKQREADLDMLYQ